VLGSGVAGPLPCGPWVLDEAAATSRALVLGLTGAALLATACSSHSTAVSAPVGTVPAAASGTAGPGISKVLFLGDSVALQEALPLAVAFKASHAGFQSIAAAGGGNVVGPFSVQNWKTLPAQIASAKPSVVIYQLTTYDWGTGQQQREAYEKLLTTVTAVGARLIFVTSPPIRPDDFYQPHMADLDRAPSIARSVAAGSSGKARVFDADAVWGSTYQRLKDGTADRSADGIHTCPQGAARFTGC
jgi:hypothetical protein